MATVNTLVLSLLLTRVPVKDHDPSAVAVQACWRKASGAFSELETSAGSDDAGAVAPDGGAVDGAVVAVAGAVVRVSLGWFGAGPPLEHPASATISTAGSIALYFIVPPNSRRPCHGLQ
jgi:hypothetical protein